MTKEQSLDIFTYGAKESTRAAQPLAERMRPRHLNDTVGQDTAVGPGTLLRHAIDQDRVFSMILWGPPGCGKTTLARIIARRTRSFFVYFSAVLSGVRDIRAVIKDARDQRNLHRRKTLLFVDEIHRFNKAQQDAFLHHVENGLITLIGATTENPSFEVIPALMSRCRVIQLKQLNQKALAAIITRALTDETEGLGRHHLTLAPDAMEYLVQTADGDARTALNNLEAAAAMVTQTTKGDGGARKTISLAVLEKAFRKKALLYDKQGEEHYNLISAFHKSMRGSDPDAALYWLARMLVAGEDPLYIARRMVRFASEDVGNADPLALRLAIDAGEAFRFLGAPEGELAMAQAAVYLATAPKSNRVYQAYGRAREAVKNKGALPVPLHLRNAPTRLMQELGYGKGYRYAHDYQDAYVSQNHLPEAIKGQRFYQPSSRGMEKAIGKRMAQWRQVTSTTVKKK